MWLALNYFQFFDNLIAGFNMKLFSNKTSPYARMVRILILEKEMTEKVDLVWCDPWSDDENFLKINPLGRIPSLVLESGLAINESIIIANYLDSIDEKTPSLIPNKYKENVFYLMGLGQGIMDAAFSIVISKKYLGRELDNSILNLRRFNGIRRSLGQLEENIEKYSHEESITLGDISIAVSLSYILFRIPEMKINDNYPKLSKWCERISSRSSFESTAFK
ncbi:Glutathione S-transferase domain [Marinomonas mediterranea MMB-1]|jgi:Glutathione S-transferase|uniref:Glutathione S-transferase domain n=2 Tax=Marinomonas mediterranea TaxID=119864 RepID=F2JYT6_MARM1|nr:Glutathione S-transferase domain [Marinomonas mediterranea MMB-1]